MEKLASGFVFNCPWELLLKTTLVEPRGHGASSTVNQTAMRGLATNIIHYSSGGTSI
jgi:hypothetical protein